MGPQPGTRSSRAATLEQAAHHHDVMGSAANSKDSLDQLIRARKQAQLCANLRTTIARWALRQVQSTHRFFDAEGGTRPSTASDASQPSSNAHLIHAGKAWLCANSCTTTITRERAVMRADRGTAKVDPCKQAWLRTNLRTTMMLRKRAATPADHGAVR